MSRTMIRPLIIIAFLLAICTSSMAVLASSSLSSLIAESDVIVRGQIVAAELTDEGGIATVQVNEVLKGPSDLGRVRLGWSNHHEDEELGDVGSERLLFLKRQENGEYAGAQFGRSYLPLYLDRDTREYVLLLINRARLITLDCDVVIGTSRVRVEVMKPGNRWVDVKSIAMSELERVIRSEGNVDHQSGEAFPESIRHPGS